jgi:prepilin-type N-terminal cleavage/methylation domain-containing protein
MIDPKMLRTRYGDNHGFTLVEVIVVSVIVAVLALGAVLLYIGYVNDARKNNIENVAASAAGFLNSAVNLDAAVPGAGIATPLTEAGKWELTTPAGGACVLRCPVGTQIDIDAGTKTVTARYVNHNVVSSPYKYDN